jgi:PAS domain S-box-containing protein
LKRTTVSERALVLAPLGRDAAVAVAILSEAGISAVACASLADLVAALDAGAGFVVLTEEAVATADLHPLSSWLDDQEEWSDLPFVLLTSRGGGLERNPAAGRHLEVLGNVTFLERPFHPTTLVSLGRSALRGRLRQYEARSRLQALHESETRYRVLFESLDEGFCIIRFLDGPHGPLSDYVHVEANPAYTRHAGLPNVVGRNVREMMPEEADSWVERFRRVLLTGEPIRFDQELVVTGRHLELAAFRVEPASRQEVAVLFQDITARRRAEVAIRDLNESLERRVAEAIREREAALAQLHEVQKLETIGQLTGGVAHDFNNLLTPITGALDMLSRRNAPEDVRSARLIDNALQSAERAKTLVQRLLGFARRQTLETRAVDLGELVQGMRDLVASSVGPAIEVRISVAPDLQPALADPNQLELAILNLAVNARDAMPDGGVLTIAAEPAPVGAAMAPAAAPYVRLSVTDTGIGMDEETLARAVEPFFSTKGVGKGTGLGLSMVHGLAGQLGGAFQLTSDLGKGTRAELILPVAQTSAQPLRRIAAQGTISQPPLRLLLVDDEPVIRTGTAEMLRDLGHTVTEAGGGREALSQLARSTEIDLLVTDYMMPQMDGAELARRARAMRPGIPVLVVTGYAGGDLDIGVPQLAKPFRQADLAAAIAAACQTSNTTSPRQNQANGGG